MGSREVWGQLRHLRWGRDSGGGYVEKNQAAANRAKRLRLRMAATVTAICQQSANARSSAQPAPVRRWPCPFRPRLVSAVCYPWLPRGCRPLYTFICSAPDVAIRSDRAGRTTCMTTSTTYGYIQPSYLLIPTSPAFRSLITIGIRLLTRPETCK